MDIKRTWWKEAVVYQIYPRSFKDSDGDGIGDLKGIISKLDYLESLGIDVIWLNPVYKSPNRDNGYDISDYRNIMSEFGTMEDFDVLLESLHKRNIKLVMDLVVNHCSDEHFWFQEAKKSRDNSYRDYFHWVPAEKGKPNKRWSFFDPNADAWKYDENTNAYYLHYFSEAQPDLNWENPRLRKEIYDMMHFWFKKGIDGFRMDVITFISKDTSFPELPDEFKNKPWDYFYASGPKLHEYLQEMNREVLSHYDVMTVAEAPGTTPENILDLVGEDRKELNMAYHFDLHYLGLSERRTLSPEGWALSEFKEIFTKWDTKLKDKGWGTVYLGNHDQPRMVTRWGNDSDAFRELSSKMLTTFLLSMRGTPYYYQGDELGMTNIKFDTIDRYRDIETINWYELTKNEGGNLTSFLEDHKTTARDNGRTPMQWSAEENGGFTEGTPWLEVNKNYKVINAESQETNPNSPLNYFRKMVQLRKNELALVYGDYAIIDADNSNVYAYKRSFEGTELLVMLNFKEFDDEVECDIDFQSATVLISNYVNGESNGVLRPYEAKILKIS